MAHPTAALAAVGVFGLVIGSFLNVVILRLPRRLEWQWRREARTVLELPEPEPPDPEPAGIAAERSECPLCGHGIRWYENIPLLSFLWLRGRCSACGGPISWQYPAVEFATAVLFVAVVAWFGWSWQALGGLVLTAYLIALTGIDARTQLLPDLLTLPLLWLGLLLSLAGLYVSPQQAILGAAFGYLMLWSVYWLFKLLTGKEGMGYGDFKLLGALGAWVGIEQVLIIVLLAAVAGTLIGGGLMLLAGRDRNIPFAFGPYLAGAGWLTFLFGDHLAAWLFGLVLLG